MDLSRFEGDFLQEAGEHLAQMENLLVRIDPEAPHPDEINAIFRAAHSIKGSSGMLGSGGRRPATSAGRLGRWTNLAISTSFWA